MFVGLSKFLFPREISSKYIKKKTNVSKIDDKRRELTSSPKTNHALNIPVAKVGTPKYSIVAYSASVSIITKLTPAITAGLTMGIPILVIL